MASQTLIARCARTSGASRSSQARYPPAMNAEDITGSLKFAEETVSAIRYHFRPSSRGPMMIGRKCQSMSEYEY